MAKGYTLRLATYKLKPPHTMKTILLSLFQLLILLPIVKAQTTDTVFIKEVVIDQLSAKPNVGRLDTIVGTYIYTGKKTEVVSLTEQDAIVTNKVGRSLFAKVPGIFVYDMDGAGNQVNISARGLDAHRGWEFNIRRDGIITNSDMYGYPASHYSMPMESIDRIEIVRGTGALGYGAQFGGMLNYITKEPDTTKNSDLRPSIQLDHMAY